MGDETDSWFKSAFGVDLSASLHKMTNALAEVQKAGTELVESVQGSAMGSGAGGVGSFPLGGSVGRGGENAPNDVRAVQSALGIAADGRCGPKTIATIKAFQTYIGYAKPDGRVDVGGATERALAADVTKPVFTAAQVESAEEVAVLEIESSLSTTDSTGHDDSGSLVSDLLGHQAALLEALESAGSEAEREQISEELEGVNSEIDLELSSLKAAEEIEKGDSVAPRAGASEEGTKDESVVDEVLMGDFHEGKTTWTGTIANVGVGVVPVLGQVADARDTLAAAKNLYDDPSLANAGILGLAAVGWVPLLGDAAKGVVKVGRKAAKEGSEEVLEETSGELVQQVGKDVAQGAETKAAQELSDEAVSKADDAAFDETFSGGLDEGEFHTSEPLKRGNLGEKLATDWLSSEGHKILSFKPSILGTNQGGIDIVTLKDGIVHFVDNKALSRSGNVSAVSALTTNFGANKAAVLTELKNALTKAGSKDEREVLQMAIDAIESGNYKLLVMSANVLKKDGKTPSGVTERLKDRGLEFIDAFRPAGKP
jgi:Holliday junction resolvase-like predicted endonuclease